MLEKYSLFPFRPPASFSFPNLVYENPFISAFAAILVFSTLYHTYTWVTSSPRSRPQYQHLHSLLRDAHLAIRKSEKALRQKEKVLASMLTSTSPITVLEWKRMEHSLQQALLSLDTIQKQGILEHYTQKFPSESHEQVLLAFTKYERKKFLHHFDQLKLKRKILVDRYLKALTTIDTQLSLLES